MYQEGDSRTWKKNSKSLFAGSKLVMFSSSALIDSWSRYTAFQCESCSHSCLDLLTTMILEGLETDEDG